MGILISMGRTPKMFENSDDEWNTFGNKNPYFGVISEERMQKQNLNEQSMLEFWRSGQEYADAVFLNIKHHICPNFKPEKALDFGCGVGRLLFAFSTKCEHVTGVDVSSAMLQEAKRQAEKKSIANLSFIESSNCDELRDSQFDFLHSYIVFQHIPVGRGNAILDKLLASLCSGGVGVLHFTFNNPKYRAWKIISKIPYNKQIRNFIHGRPLDEPFMQMNEYDLNKILKKIKLQGVSTCYLEFTDHGVCGVTIYFKKT
jgi:ubiquinone/menaquinone biosynthesis C-methylase UbiE